MSRFDRLLGLARSMAIYHGIAGRHRRLRTLYAGFVASGDLVFDVGAHAGNRARAFASLGCRVVAIEPQPDFARVLRALFRHNHEVTIVEAAVSDAAGQAPLAVSERTPTVTTLSDKWREARAQEEGFRGVQWNRRIEVVTTTLDRLIVRYGAPRFVKIDCEGSEAAILAGLTQAVPALSFEFLPWTLEDADACVARLKRVGPYEFNWSKGETGRLVSERWLNDLELLAALRTPEARRRAGDVYARLIDNNQPRTR